MHSLSLLPLFTQVMTKSCEISLNWHKAELPESRTILKLNCLKECHTEFFSVCVNQVYRSFHTRSQEAVTLVCHTVRVTCSEHLHVVIKIQIFGAWMSIIILQEEVIWYKSVLIFCSTTLCLNSLESAQPK